MSSSSIMVYIAPCSLKLLPFVHENSQFFDGVWSLSPVILITTLLFILFIIPNLYSTFIICAYVQKCFTQNTLKHTQIH